MVIEGRATEGGILRGSSRLRRMSVFGLCRSWWQLEDEFVRRAVRRGLGKAVAGS